ncbi:MAG: TVP38/TMEM64 family protein [Elusimicrobiota bacterium]
MADLLKHALAHIAAMGATGYVVFILLYAASCIAFLPVSVLTFGAGALFGVGPGFALVWIGATIGACSSFLIGRHWLRGWVEKRLARYPLFTAIDAAVSVQGGRVVFLTRLTPLFPFNTLNYAYGLTRVKFRDYAIASFLGMAPGTLLFVYAGAVAGEAVAAGRGRVRTPAEWAFYGVGLLVAVIVVTLVGRTAKRALAAHTKPEAGL